MHLKDLRYPPGNRFWNAYRQPGRYLAVALLVTLVIVAITLLAHASLEQARERYHHANEERQQAARQLRQLRNSMVTLERNLNGYLRHAGNVTRERVQETLNHTRLNQQHLQGIEWFKSHPGEKQGLDLTGLERAIGPLLESPAQFDTEHAESLLATLWQEIRQLDQQLESLAHTDSAPVDDILTLAIHTLWLLAAIVLVLVSLTLIYYGRRKHNPPAATLSADQGSPSQSLIEAYREMHQRVMQRQQSLEHLALHDTLTGLANREQLVRAIDKVLGSSVAGKHEVALLMLGMNRFREINNSLGHNVGDQLLIGIARRLTKNNPSNALIARVNGDEFTLLLTGSASHMADSVARDLIKALEAPFVVENQPLYISAAIGIALSPEHGRQPLDLLQKAEVAMQVAKQQKVQLVHYNSDYDRHAMRRLALANTLRQELAGHEETLSLVYHPQIEMRTGNVCGIEALVRWESRREGWVTPDELIPIAEQTGLIHQLTPWVLEHAFKEYSSLTGRVAMKPVLAVNLSSLNLHDSEFPYHLQHLMEKWAIDPAYLQLEITESVMMADAVRAHRTLGHIHSLGVELTIDDFGTGFSSLAYLKHLPVSKLKIDKSFVSSMLQDENDAVIVRSTIDMAHHMGLKVVAEGVENQETYDLLEILDCDIAQGYLISTPLDLATLEQWIPLQQKRAVRHRPLYAGHYPR